MIYIYHKRHKHKEKKSPFGPKVILKQSSSFCTEMGNRSIRQLCWVCLHSKKATHMLEFCFPASLSAIFLSLSIQDSSHYDCITSTSLTKQSSFVVHVMTHYVEGRNHMLHVLYP